MRCTVTCLIASILLVWSSAFAQEDRMRAFKDNHRELQELASESLTSCIGGMANTYPCSNVDLLAFLPLNQIGGGSGNDIWGWTDTLTGKEYAIMGRTNGTSFIDISDPANPVYLGTLPPHSANSTWRDIKVYADHAYMVTEAANSGMQVFDLTQLLNVPAPPVTFAETTWYNGFSEAHNLVINEDSGYAYAVGTDDCSGGLHIIDLANPISPVAAGCFADDGFTHDAQCVNYIGPDPDYAGREICFNFNVDALTIADVTIKGATVQVSRTDYTLSQYAHQGWLTEDQNYLLLGDEQDERTYGFNTRTYIWDISDLDLPIQIDFYSGSTSSVDHNQYIKENFSYQSNYQAGLRILDISDIANGNLFEAGYFDIYPIRDEDGFNGSWSNYPFFDSGVVVVSGIEQGMYVLMPNLGPTPPMVEIVNPANNAMVWGTETVRIDATDKDPLDSLNVEWNVNGGAWQPAAYEGPYYEASWDTTTAIDGLNTINARAIDSDFQMGRDAIDVDVSNGIPAFHIADIHVSVVAAKGRRNRGVATVTVLDQSLAPVDVVSVTGTFSGDWAGVRSNDTNGAGVAEMQTPLVKNGNYWIFCVDSAVKSGWLFDDRIGNLCGDTDSISTFGTITGKVTNLETSLVIKDATVSVDSGQSDVTDSGGDYAIDSVPTGTRTVTVTADAYNSASLQTTVTDGNTSVVDFALTKEATGGFGTIRGTVTDISGARLSGALVQVQGGPSGTTNGRGKYMIQNVAAGAQTGTASKAGYVSDSESVTVYPGLTSGMNFRLTPSP